MLPCWLLMSLNRYEGVAVMRGYHPPHRPILRAGAFFRPVDELPLPPSFAIHGTDLVRGAMDPAVVPAVAVMCGVIRQTAVRTGRLLICHLSPRSLASIVYHGLGVDCDPWPLSLASVIEGVRHADVDVISDILSYCAGPADVCDGLSACEALRETVDMALTVPKSVDCMRSAIGAGLVIAAGLSVDPRWTDAAAVATGNMLTPPIGEVLVDGDCVVLDGWDDPSRCFRCLFAAGGDWGRGGRGWIPYSYFAPSSPCHELIAIPLTLDT